MTSLPNRPEVRPVTMSFQQWLQHGEMLYQSAMQEFHALEAQMDELERRLAAKQAELHQIITMMSKPPIESTRKPLAQQAAAPAPEETDRPASPAGPAGPRPLGGRVIRQPSNGANGA